MISAFLDTLPNLTAHGMDVTSNSSISSTSLTTLTIDDLLLLEFFSSYTLLISPFWLVLSSISASDNS